MVVSPFTSGPPRWKEEVKAGNRIISEGDMQVRHGEVRLAKQVVEYVMDRELYMYSYNQPYVSSIYNLLRTYVHYSFFSWGLRASLQAMICCQ